LNQGIKMFIFFSYLS